MLGVGDGGQVRGWVVGGAEDGGAGGAADEGEVVGEVVGAPPEVGGELSAQPFPAAWTQDNTRATATALDLGHFPNEAQPPAQWPAHGELEAHKLLGLHVGGLRHPESDLLRGHVQAQDSEGGGVQVKLADAREPLRLGGLLEVLGGRGLLYHVWSLVCRLGRCSLM